MTSQIVLGTVMAVGAGALAVSGQAPAAACPTRRRWSEVEKIKDNLFMLKGGGGNTAVFVGTSGVVVVDTKLAGLGPAHPRQDQGADPKPVTTIINTHTHGDHVSGNVEFPATVEIVTQENTRRTWRRWPGVPGARPIKAAALRRAHVQGQDDCSAGADQMDLYYFGRGAHERRRLRGLPGPARDARGRHLRAQGAAALDGNNGGSGVRIGDTLAKAPAGIKSVDTVITGPQRR